MEYNVIEFKQFLKENNVKTKALPEPIQEKIVIFYRLHELLDRIQEPDFQELLAQVEQLDIEILEDIEEQYEDQLENNERIEKPKREQEINKPALNKKTEIKRDPEEVILDELVKMGRSKGIGRSKLKDMGIKTKLGSQTVIGKYTLKRTSMFYYRYDIVPLKKE